ncbi:hypothetical protein SUGI_0270130 [Cryptomeria japonica]|uniref:endoglucanase 25 n=1 Tax=Cryptomeria japonica TaxID=3369 RepID=UPI002408945A|nr:endoglucanase 25 [Cryptomeria japonica]GLJ16176.1 hypothetical protein SUGI_0270130 [Cryptomeria japonica]
MRAFGSSRSGNSFEMSTDSSGMGDCSISTTQYYNMTPFKEYIGVSSGMSPESGYGRNMSSQEIEETQKSWLLHPLDIGGSRKTVNLGFFICKKSMFANFIYTIFIAVILAGLVAAIVIFAPRKHHHSSPPDKYTLALHQALLFFDAQKSGYLNSSNIRVEFRGDSGLQDGHFRNKEVDLVGGYYDSGNNIKFGFPTAYTITLISWSVLEYREKYEAAGELDHVKDIIQWGTDYLLKTFNSSNPQIDTIYSQVGSAINDIECWQRPEDMEYKRPVSECKGGASDLAGEMAAALGAASLVFKDSEYSAKLVEAAQKVYEFAQKSEKGKYTDSDPACGGAAVGFYNSSGYYDELMWGGVWVFFATGNWSYLQHALNGYNTDNKTSLNGVFDWDDKLFATQVLLTRLRIVVDPGYPYVKVLKSSTETTEATMCSYLPDYPNFDRTPGGLVLVKPGENGGHLQYAATSAFLSKLYSDYLSIIGVDGWTCGSDYHRSQLLQQFSTSQIDYILGKNPMNMSYVVGFGKKYPSHVYHRGASIPSISIDKHQYSCSEGKKWLTETAGNPNCLNGSMVGGPGSLDQFSDDRTKPNFTQPTIAANAGLLAALVAHSMPGKPPSSSSWRDDRMIDSHTIFSNILLPPPSSAPPPTNP